MLRNLRYASRNLLRRYPATITQVNYVENSASDEPVKFSASKASQWKASYTRSGEPQEKEDDVPWFQTYVVVASVAAFLLYFCVLREENDIDEVLGTSLYDQIEGLEEAQLRIVLKYNLEHGKDTTNIKKRIKELEVMRGKTEDS